MNRVLYGFNNSNISNYLNNDVSNVHQNVIPAIQTHISLNSEDMVDM